MSTSATGKGAEPERDATAAPAAGSAKPAASGPGSGTPAPGSPADEGADAVGRKPTGGRTPGGALGQKEATPGPVIDMTRNPVGTAAVIAAVLLVVLGVIANLMLFSSVDDVDSLRRFATVRDLLGIILGTGTVVLGIIGLTSRRTPRWGALVGLGIGSYVFLSSLASFVGSLLFD